MKSFDGRVAAITGAGSGIGRALAIGLAHRGTHLALADIDESGLVETVCAFVLAFAALALITCNRRAWEATLVSHVISIAGTILGVVAITAGRGEHNLPNDIFHRVVLVAMVAVLVLLWTPAGRRAKPPNAPRPAAAA